MRFLLACVPLMCACTTAVPMPSAQQSEAAAKQWPGTTNDDLLAGRTLFTDRCGGCHALPETDAHKPEDWPKVVEDMGKRSNLNEGERSKVMRYLVTMAKK